MEQANIDFSLRLKKTRKCEFLEQYFTLSQPGMEEAFFDVYRKFAQIPVFSRMPDKINMLCFRHRLKMFKVSDQIPATVNDTECPVRQTGAGSSVKNEKLSRIQN